MTFTYRRESNITMYLPAWGGFEVDDDNKAYALLMDYVAEDPTFFGCFMSWEEANPNGTCEFNWTYMEHMNDEEIVQMFWNRMIPEEPAIPLEYNHDFEEFPF